MSVAASISADLVMGSVFANRYRVERRLATGGMGAVYEVVHLETNRRRALKVMHAHYVSSDELRMRFRQEARVAAEIESEHIVDVFDAGVDDATGMPFLVMELLRGEELGRHLKRVGPLAREDVVRYLYETSLALDKTHRARIVHRDLKPDNLFLCEREHGPPRIKVLDFGIAKLVKDAETRANATRSLGTPLYMAPEQFQLKSAVSAATDVFALGMIAFTLLAGKPYWHTESSMAAEAWAFAMHVATGPKESAVARAWELFGVELPPAFDAWFFRATAYEPGARFASAGEAVKALAEALGVPSPANEFGAKPSKDVGSLPTGKSPETPLMGSSPSVRTGPSGPRTGPTMLAMTPESDAVARPRDKRGAQPWMVATVAGAVFSTGLGAVLIARQLATAPAVAGPAPSQARPALEAAPTTAVVVPSAAIEPLVKAEPVQTPTPPVGSVVPPLPVQTNNAPPNPTTSAKPSERASTRSNGPSAQDVKKVAPAISTKANPGLDWTR